MTLTPRHRFLLFLGPPGSGKGTQTHLLKALNNNSFTSLNSQKPIDKLPEQHNFYSISAGDVLRQEAKTNDELRRMLAAGEFAPEELTRRLMEENVQRLVQQELDSMHAEEISSTTEPAMTIILDGYPRTPHQLEYILDRWKDSVHLNAHNTTIFELLASTEAIMRRLQGRWIHLDSGRTYHDEFKPPIVPQHDDVTGEPLTRRDDDAHPDIIQRRIQNYNQVSRPMLETLRMHGFHIDEVPEGTIDEVHNYITSKLDIL